MEIFYIINIIITILKSWLYVIITVVCMTLLSYFHLHYNYTVGLQLEVLVHRALEKICGSANPPPPPLSCLMCVETHGARTEQQEKNFQSIQKKLMYQTQFFTHVKIKIIKLNTVLFDRAFDHSGSLQNWF